MARFSIDFKMKIHSSMKNVKRKRGGSLQALKISNRYASSFFLHTICASVYAISVCFFEKFVITFINLFVVNRRYKVISKKKKEKKWLVDICKHDWSVQFRTQVDVCFACITNDQKVTRDVRGSKFPTTNGHESGDSKSSSKKRWCQIPRNQNFHPVKLRCRCR